MGISSFAGRISSLLAPFTSLLVRICFVMFYYSGFYAKPWLQVGYTQHHYILRVTTQQTRVPLFVLLDFC